MNQFSDHPANGSSLKRVSAYCLPRNIRHKSVTELKELNKNGLKMVYVGIESGCDDVLQKVSKGETYQSSKEALLKLQQAGIKTSVMILNGLGGQLYSQQHLEASAALMNETQPDYLSTLVISFPKGEQRFRQNFADYHAMIREQLFEELHDFIFRLSLQGTIFRSDHASNWLPLKGILNKDKQVLLNTLRLALDKPQEIQLRPDYMRGL